MSDKTHIPAEGRGTGFDHTSECGRPMKTRTGDISIIRNRIKAEVLGGAVGDYCQACLHKAKWYPAKAAQ